MAVIINCKSADVQAVATKYRDMITTLAGTGALEYVNQAVWFGWAPC
jgi:hypothetical protein